MKLRSNDLDNLFSTTLANAITASDLTIYLNAVPTNATEGFLVLDTNNATKREVIYYNAVGANYVSCPALGGRGQAGTSAQSHDAGAAVKQNFLREHFKPVRDAVFTGFVDLNYTATYASSSTITIPTDLTAIFTVGHKLKLTFASSGAKFFTILSSSYSSPNTTITLYGDTVLEETINSIEMDVNPQAYSDNDVIVLNEKSAAPGTPTSGKAYLYQKDDGKLYLKNDAGTESAIEAPKKIAPITTTEESSATPTINVDKTDIHTITALATDITSFTTKLSGTPVNGQKLIIRIKDDGTARAITWGDSFVSRGATLPTTTVLGKYLYVGFLYNSTASVWDCVAVSQEV